MRKSLRNIPKHYDFNILDTKTDDEGINNQPRYKYMKRNVKKIHKDFLNSSIIKTNRIISTVPYPEMKILNESDVYVRNNVDKPSWVIIMEHFRKEGRVHDDVLLRILKDAEKIFKTEPTLLELNDPINVCGDIHGQYYDLMKLFQIGGLPPKVKYVFLGDYVDRGSFGLEVIILLFSLKINYPDSLYLLRGNHESRRMTEVFTFRREMEIKSNILIYDYCMRTFDALPLAALISKELLCMHGGLSPEIQYLEDINFINRFREPPTYGPMCDLLWSDPLPEYNDDINKPLFRENTARRCSYFFTYEACMNFLKRNKLITIVRAHEVKESGYEFYKENTNANSPSLITIFSAPAYLDIFQNAGVILNYDNKAINIKQFTESPHPLWLPDFIDAINYSIPFIVEQSTKFWMAILRLCENTRLNDFDFNDIGIGNDDNFYNNIGNNINKNRNIGINGSNHKHETHKKLVMLSKTTSMLSDKRKKLENAVDLKGLSTPNTINSKMLKNINDELVQNIAKGNYNYKELQKIDAQNESNPAVSHDQDTEKDKNEKDIKIRKFKRRGKRNL